MGSESLETTKQVKYFHHHNSLLSRIPWKARSGVCICRAQAMDLTSCWTRPMRLPSCGRRVLRHLSLTTLVTGKVLCSDCKDTFQGYAAPSLLGWRSYSIQVIYALLQHGRSDSVLFPVTAWR